MKIHENLWKIRKNSEKFGKIRKNSSKFMKIHEKFVKNSKNYSSVCWFCCSNLHTTGGSCWRTRSSPTLFTCNTSTRWWCHWRCSTTRCSPWKRPGTSVSALWDSSWRTKLCTDSTELVSVLICSRTRFWGTQVPTMGLVVYVRLVSR